ncbi:retinoid-inducible serine carboxypeptidase isoform X2 [Monomorium pharaonis]|nr:retinoid-inducible serine carboxypeptidase isoform X2 [Monomorium pharaonis]
MFWWLYYTTANVDSYYDRPLLIWLQGKLPGESSTSYGNFERLGPLDANLNPRNYTWVKDYNVLFIDSPVGTGFSYAQIEARYTKANEQIAKDLVECMRGFYKELPQFRNVPTYITTEAYGGKMGAEFALLWDEAQKNGTINSNLKGIALGDAWISPIDSVLTWAPYLLNAGTIDTEGFEKIDTAAQKVKKMIDMLAWTAATEEWSNTQKVVFQETYNIDFHNILTKMSPFVQTNTLMYSHLKQSETFSLDDLMNGPVREALGINTKYMHGEQSRKVFEYLMGDFMKPVTHIVERLLNETDLNIFVYSGQLDLIGNTPSTLVWIDKLKWENIDAWKNSNRNPIVVENIIEGYFKIQDNFRMYWVNRAGHIVLKDHPIVQEIILRDLTSNANK